MKTSYLYREFADGTPSKKAKFGAVGVGIGDFPPETPEEAEGARQKLRDAFRQNYHQILDKK